MKAISNSHILITGGTGSFGNKVATHLRNFSPSRVTIFSRDEKKQYDMRRKFPEFHYVLGDVRDYTSIYDALRGVDFVFHAAALKQVPNCELYPAQAMATNAAGSHNVCRAAAERGVQTVVALSTDKAVKPVNAMGITKALMEKIVLQSNRPEVPTRFCCVRYGNVIGSRGSVIPLFRKQIAAGGPVTITDPAMTRFLLTLEDAIGLVLYALEHSGGGEIFVRKAPACTVAFLAETMIKAYGDKSRHIAIKAIGTRVGEKVHETLINEYEVLRAEDRGEFFKIPAQEDGASPPMFPADSAPAEYSSDVTRQITDPDELLRLLEIAKADEEG